MTELEYVVENFGDRFAEFRGKRLALCGGGDYHDAIMERWGREFVFCALEDGPDIAVLTKHKVKSEPDYLETAPFCEEKGIPLYDMYGIDEIAVHREAEQQSFLHLKGWEEAVRGYDVVSFAAIDTYLRQGSLLKSDLTIRPIFRVLTDIIRSRGGHVVFICRNAVPIETVRKILMDEGVLRSEEEAAQDLYRRQGEDLCYRMIRERFPQQRILHIGISIPNDFIIPRFYGIDTRRMVFYGQSRADQPKPAFAKPACRSREQIMDAVSAVDIVSFDLFDTLLQRDVLKPEDVFEIVQRRCGDRKIKAPGFAFYRRLAQEELPLGTLDEIYGRMGELTGADSLVLEDLKAAELSVEREVISPREAVVSILKEARSMGKGVVVTTDMYLPGAFLRQLLAGCGIDGVSEIFVSCERGCDKAGGLLGLVRERFPGKRILHIGDREDADLAAALDAGIEGALIPSAAALAAERGWERCFEKASSLSDRGLLALAVNKAFSDPFLDPGSMSRSEICARYAWTAAGPMVIGYVTWLIKRAKETKPDGILFGSRDGWILSRVFELFEKVSEGLPPATYFYAGRHAAFQPCEDNPASAYHILQMSRRVRYEELLKQVFGLDEGDVLPRLEDEAEDAYLKRHQPLIKARAERARGAYLKYIEKLGLIRGGRYYYTDFVAEGTTQLLLSQFVPFSLSGMYFGRPFYQQEDCGRVEYYLGCEDPYFIEHYMEMEAVMTSPEPSLDHFSDDGSPVFSRETRSDAMLRQVGGVHSGIMSLAERFIRLFYEEGEVVSPGLTEVMYGAEGGHRLLREDFDDWMKVRI